MCGGEGIAADLLKQADMQPYFDNAVGAIHTTTNVVSAVAFNLLPASMKADVDAVVKPVKATAWTTSVPTITNGA